MKETDQAFNILATSVIGSIAEQMPGSGHGVRGVATPSVHNPRPHRAAQPQAGGFPRRWKDLQGPITSHRPRRRTCRIPRQGWQFEFIHPAAPPPQKGSYEARVMQGIWAAAPYLHNGSVPTLAELLKPAATRVKQFKIGNAYDTVDVGLATEQSQFNQTLVTTDCSNLNSGNSNCGHEFGTKLPDADKKALLEYLKTL